MPQDTTVHQDSKLAAPLTPVQGEVENAEAHTTAQDKAPAETASAVQATTAQAVAENAEAPTIAQGKDRAETESAAQATTVQVVAENAAVLTIAQGKDRAETESAAQATIAQAAAESAEAPTIAPGIDDMPMNLDHVYTLPEGLHRFERDGKIILINSAIPAWIVTDAVGELILSLFDGENTVKDIIDIAGSGIAVEIVSKFISEVIASGIFDTRTTPPQYIPGDLQSVHLSLSEDCNLKCKYCYARLRQESSTKPLTIEEYRNLITQLTEAFPRLTITLTGGEPLLNPHWKEIARMAKEGGAKVFLLTNGLLINESNIADISGLFDLVTLSVDGSSADVHALTRGNNLKQVEDAITLLDKNGIDHTLSMTVTRSNIRDVEKMARKHGERLNFAPLFPTGSETSGLTITGKEYYDALASAFGVNPLSYCKSALLNSRNHPAMKCSIGDGTLSISATGDIYPCQLLHDETLLVGNTRDNPDLVTLIKNSTILKKCTELTVDNMEGCRDCAYRYLCGGACRARAFYEGGSLEKASPFCIYEQSAFLDGILKLYSANIMSSAEFSDGKSEN